MRLTRFCVVGYDSNDDDFLYFAVDAEDAEQATELVSARWDVASFSCLKAYTPEAFAKIAAEVTTGTADLTQTEPTDPEEDDGERLHCAICGDSFNVHDSCDETHCLKCVARKEGLS